MVTVSAFPRIARTSPRARKWIAGTVAAIAVASVALLLARPGWLPLTSALLAIFGIWIGLAPGIAYIANPERPPIPFLPLTGLFYVVFFALPAFFVDPEWWSVAPVDSGAVYGITFRALSPIAIGLIPAGLVLMLGAHAATARAMRRRVPRLTLPRLPGTGRVRLLLWPLLLGHLAYLIVPSLGQVASVGQLLGPVGFLAYGMFYVLWAQGRLPRTEALAVFVVLLPVELLQLFTTGLLSKVVYFCVFMAVTMIYVRSWRLIAVLVVLVPLFLVAFYPAVQGYRVKAWSEAASSGAGRTGSALFVDVMLDKWRTGYRSQDFAGLKVPLLRRISLIVLFSYVVEHTPSPVPYLGGASYAPLATSFIPRAIWPGKPEERLGQSFGHRYGILLPSDRTTSINVPWNVEMYANFGIWGVLIGMALVGVLFAFLEAVFNRSEMSPLEFVVGATIVLPLFYHESNFSLMTGSMLPLTLCLWLYFRIGLTVGGGAGRGAGA